jgi:drug/metabolite transporter (DMT)-like permease
MNWFLIALITPIVHAAVVHIDKHLVSKYLKGAQVGSLVLFSALFAVVALPFIGWFHPEAFDVSAADVALLMVNGALLVLAYICYFYALDRDEASVVAPLFQMIPVMGFALGYFLLGETLSPREFIASAVIVAGALILSLERHQNGLKLKQAVFWLMFASSFLYAANGVLFKFVAETQQAFWPSLFWDFAGKVVFGLLIFAMVKGYREQFLAVLKENKSAVMTLNGLNEVLGLVGEGALVFAVLLAPVALVQVVSGLQPAFVFFYGILLTLFWPQFTSESLERRHLIHKAAGIGIILVGTVLLNL